MKIQFTVHGKPEPKGSKKAFAYEKDGKLRASIVDDNKKTLKVWKNDFTLQSNRYKPKELLEGPIKVRLIFYLERPKSVKPENRPLPIVKPDVDKLCRTVMDLLSKRFYVDDNQVVDLGAYKRYMDKPGVDVLIEEIKGE